MPIQGDVAIESHARHGQLGIRIVQDGAAAFDVAFGVGGGRLIGDDVAVEGGIRDVGAAAAEEERPGAFVGNVAVEGRGHHGQVI